MARVQNNKNSLDVVVLAKCFGIMHSERLEFWIED